MNVNYDESNRFLGMLAEVAVKTLNTEEHKHWNRVSHTSDAKQKMTTKNAKNALNVDQLRKLSDKVLIESFSELSCDRMHRLFRYKCVLMPHNCQLVCESFATEDRARTQMRDHLLDHISNAEPNFMAEKSSARNRRLNESNKCRKSAAKDSQKRAVNTNDSFPKNGFNESQFTDGSHDNQYVILTIDPLFEMNREEKDSNSGLKDSTNSGNNLNDHCYTSLNGPKVKAIPIKKSDENVMNTKNNKWMSNSKVIATPAFPFIYEPVLPNISQVVEIGSTLQNKCKTKRSFDKINVELSQTISDSVGEEVNANPNSVQLKRLALQYINDMRVMKSKGQTKSAFRCKICIDKTFTSPTTLIYHYRSHAGVKPYECSLCKATFTRQHSLNYHTLIHLNKSRFVCEECGRNFRHPSHFKEHMRRHTGETPYECNECFIKFKTRNTYKRHLQTKHAKMLTSKGIFDLPNSNIHLRKPCPPRRKYGLGFLHQNIEAVARYERAQEEVNQSIRDNCHLINEIDSNLLINNCNQNYNSSENNFEKLLQAVAIAEDDERAVIK